MSIAIVWFRRDLRLADNPALDAALQRHERIVPLYVHAPHEEEPWAPGAASRWWLHHSLHALDAALGRRGARLHVMHGDSTGALRALLERSGARALYWNRLYEPALVERDAIIERTLRGVGVEVGTFKADVLFEPSQIATAQDQPYRVFTPFWRTARARLEVLPPMPAPRRIATPDIAPDRSIDSLGLLPRIAWDTGFNTAWTPGEAGAETVLARFLDDTLAGYASDRDRPDLDGTSRLSPHLHFGEIAPMRVAWEIFERLRSARSDVLGDAGESYVRELGWRDFSRHLLFHFPQMPETNLNPRFDAFPWARDNPRLLRRWQQGRTGIPIIDAGMRELWHTGYMHNRVRMLVASFLTKNLRQHWSHGARWFWDTLVDADLANNAQGWQWTAGVGVDASPYFRIFNPVTQGERHDPHGTYVRRWLPELAEAPEALVHAPWRDPELLARSGYAMPIVDLAVSRERALTAYRDMTQH